MKNGKGKLIFNKNNAEFKGEFKDDEVYGEGIYKDELDNVYSTKKGDGVFIKLRLNGEGKAKLINGDLYEGEFKDGYFSG
jgi:hypothetical protein